MFWSMSIPVCTSLCDCVGGGRETITEKEYLSRETIDCIMCCTNLLSAAAGMMRTSFLLWDISGGNIILILRCHSVTSKGHFVNGFYLVLTQTYLEKRTCRRYISFERQMRTLWDWTRRIGHTCHLALFYYLYKYMSWLNDGYLLDQRLYGSPPTNGENHDHDHVSLGAFMVDHLIERTMITILLVLAPLWSTT